MSNKISEIDGAIVSGDSLKCFSHTWHFRMNSSVRWEDCTSRSIGSLDMWVKLCARPFTGIRVLLLTFCFGLGHGLHRAEPFLSLVYNSIVCLAGGIMLNLVNMSDN